MAPLGTIRPVAAQWCNGSVRGADTCGNRGSGTSGRSWCCSLLLTVLCVVASRVAIADALVLVSIDGFGHDYLDRFEPPALMAIAGQGFRVRRLLPVYPTNTFPTHLSMATGLRPEDHGIEDNHFCDALLDECYHIGDGKREPRWLKGMPIWSWVEAQGGIAATYFWPESDAPWGGQLPTYYLPYNKTTPYEERVEQVLQWLRLPEGERPQLITLYFSLVDTAGHEFGPGSPEVAAAVQEVDRHIGALWLGLQALPTPGANLLVVSDHGMARVDGSRAIVTTDLPHEPGLTMLQSSARVEYYADSDVEHPAVDIDGFLRRLTSEARGRFRVLDRDASLALGGHTERSVPAITLLTQPPAYFSRFPVARDKRGGAHGYAADQPDMAAFAVGAGPAFRRTLVDQAHQLDIFPMMLKVVNLPAPPGVASDGGPLLSILRDD